MDNEKEFHMKVDMKFEVAIVPVSDVDRAKAFYSKLGWRVDDDIVNGNDFRAVQLTPPNSAASVTFGKGVTDAKPGSFRGGLIVSDIVAAHKHIVGSGIKVKLISTGEGPKQYAVIFSAGDEAYSGLLDFAEKYHVTSAHFTAIGALSRVVLGWFDPQRKMYRENPIDEQVEVATMMGDFALYQASPRCTRT
jgi:catechol 2,3-dioxygenase-like lactoylglutathione lyase family enzyme